MAEESNDSVTLLQEDSTILSSGSADDETSRSKKSAFEKAPTAESAQIPANLGDLIEYEWPQNQPQADYYFVQEQLAHILDVKSFKRKYATLRRRPVEGDERKYLIEAHKLGETMPEHLLTGDLTALWADDVQELLAKEYTDVYEAYQRICLDKRQEQQLRERQAEAAESKAIKLDPAKLNEMRKKAIQDAFEANRELQNKRRTERKYFYDSQTSIIQCPTKKIKLQEESRMSAYPVALNHFQFQEYYKVFTPEELRRLPLNTVLDSTHLFPPRREPSPLPIRVSDEELLRQERAVAAMEQRMKKEESPAPSAETPKAVRTSARRAEKNAQRICSSCHSTEEGDHLLDKLLKCCQCQAFIHPRCAEMSMGVVKVVRGYNWVCIDCKNCTICNKADEEASMMFCDSCDRGYHTFCVGLQEPPKGTWQCTVYCKGKLQRA